MISQSQTVIYINRNRQNFGKRSFWHQKPLSLALECIRNYRVRKLSDLPRYVTFSRADKLNLGNIRFYNEIAVRIFQNNFIIGRGHRRLFRQNETCLRND